MNSTYDKIIIIIIILLLLLLLLYSLPKNSKTNVFFTDVLITVHKIAGIIMMDEHGAMCNKRKERRHNIFSNSKLDGDLA